MARKIGTPAATITLYWSDRRKEWDVVGRVGEYSACVGASSRVAMTPAQAWLMIRAVAEALEGQLPFE